jgi:hypothetical protein
MDFHISAEQRQTIASVRRVGAGRVQARDGSFPWEIIHAPGSAPAVGAMRRRGYRVELPPTT